jgi:hypothetical protein
MVTAYEGDMTLHNVVAMPAGKADKQASKK